MHYRARSFDDLQLWVMQRLLQRKTSAQPSRGPVRELSGVVLELTNPRARLSRTLSRGMVFSCLGEWIWYLSGRDDVETMDYYLPGIGDENSDDGKTLHGAYGKRLLNLRGHNQIQLVLGRLQTKPDSRRAVIQLLDVEDVANQHKDVPCTCILQFLVRSQQLHMVAYMRSNDVIKGLPHDVFAFTMFQEVIARSLGLNVGTYKHMVGSLHLYETQDDLNLARRVLAEGQQKLLPMPLMPKGDPWHALAELIAAERAFRVGEGYVVSELDKYWLDLIRLLQVFGCYKRRDEEGIRRLRNQVDPAYRMYIDKKSRTLANRALRRSRPPGVEQTRLDI